MSLSEDAKANVAAQLTATFFEGKHAVTMGGDAPRSYRLDSDDFKLKDIVRVYRQMLELLDAPDSELSSTAAEV